MKTYKRSSRTGRGYVIVIDHERQNVGVARCALTDSFRDEIGAKIASGRLGFIRGREQFYGPLLRGTDDIRELDLVRTEAVQCIDSGRTPLGWSEI